MSTKLKLSSGMDYGYGSNGERICRGARMGRSNKLPDDRTHTLKLRLERLKWHDGDYDAGGAYWGNGGGTSIYCAWFRLPSFEENQIEVFVRAQNRNEAKTKIQEHLSHATFYH